MSVQLTTIQIEKGLADAIYAEARARKMSVEDYLKTLIATDNGQAPEEPMSLSEIDQILDELSGGTDHIPALPSHSATPEEFKAALESLAEGTETLPAAGITYTREDIYFDHD